MSNVQFPDLRYEIFSAVSDLSDPIWIERANESPIAGADFDLPFHTLFDDTAVGDNPHDCIGDYLINTAEADGIKVLVHHINELFDRFGDFTPPQEAINSGKWSQIMASADAVKSMMKRSFS